MGSLPRISTHHIQSGTRFSRILRRIRHSPVSLTAIAIIIISTGWLFSGTALAALPPGTVFQLEESTSSSGEDRVEVAHDPAYQLSEGTFGQRFRANDVVRRPGLFSKDYTDNQGGDITAFVERGRVNLRLQSAEDEVWVKTPEGSVEAGVDYHLAVAFGPSGLWLYLNGMPMAWQPEFTQGLEQNIQSMAIGANTWGRTGEKPYRTRDHYVGTMSDFMLVNEQYSDAQVAELAGFAPEPQPDSNQAPVALIIPISYERRV